MRCYGIFVMTRAKKENTSKHQYCFQILWPEGRIIIVEPGVTIPKR